mgnify:FL=1
MRCQLAFSVTFTVLGLLQASAAADDPARPIPRGAFASVPDLTLREGDPVPAFQAVSTSGQLWKSEEHVGKKYVAVFF